MSTRQVVKSLYWSPGYYTLTVPKGYSPNIEIVLAGAGGGQGGQYYYGGGGAGGYGDVLKGTIPVKPGDTLQVYLGQGGQRGVYNFGGGLGGAGAKIGDPVYGSGTGQVWPVTLSWAWSQFMNDYAVWVNPDGVNPINSTSTVTRTFYVPETGTYRIRAECDNWMNLYVDGSNIINTSDFQSVYGSYADMSLTQGNHNITMAVSNWGGPAGFAVEITRASDPPPPPYDGGSWWQYGGIFEVDPDTGLPVPQKKADTAVGTVIWHTRLQPQPPANTYWLKGGLGGNTYPDGNYIYPGAAGGGAGSAVFLNGTLVVIAGGGGGGGAEGGHGAAGGAGGNAGGPGSGSNPDAYAYGAGQDGASGFDIGGQPGGGGGFVGGAAGAFIYYDDAPSAGAFGGSNYVNPLYSFTSIGIHGGGPGNGSNGYSTISFSEMGSGKVKVGGSWKQITNNYVKVGNQWKEITNAWTKADGVWKLVSGGAPIPESFTSGNYG